MAAATETFGISEPNYLDWRQRVRSMSQLAAFSGRSVSLLGDGDPDAQATAQVVWARRIVFPARA